MQQILVKLRQIFFFSIGMFERMFVHRRLNISAFLAFPLFPLCSYSFATLLITNFFFVRKAAFSFSPSHLPLFRLFQFTYSTTFSKSLVDVEKNVFHFFLFTFNRALFVRIFSIFFSFLIKSSFLRKETRPDFLTRIAMLGRLLAIIRNTYPLDRSHSDFSSFLFALFHLQRFLSSIYIFA